MKTPTHSHTNDSLSATLSRFLTSSTTLSARLLSGAVVAAVGSVAMDASALPSNGTVVSGTASIVDTANKTTVTQSTDKAIIHWDHFDTSTGETVRFIQPSATSITLNRIGDGVHLSPGFFNGNLQSNGKVWIVNPNGMVFGPTSSVKVGSMLVSTADISNDNFNNPTDLGGGKKRYTFDQESPNQANAVITINGSNWRTVEGGTDANNFNTTVKKGDFIVQAPGIAATNSGNTGANIDTHGGTFIGASGQTFTVDFNGDGLVNYSTYSVDKAVSVKLNVPHDTTCIKNDAIVACGTPGSVQAGDSNIWMGYKTHINQSDAAADTAKVKFIAKVNEDAVMDHVINLGGEFVNFSDYVNNNDLPSHGGKVYGGDMENARIVPMDADSVTVTVVHPTPAPTTTIAPTNTPAPTTTIAPTNTPAPTTTIAPTNTPAPTTTIAPTNTPAPTTTIAPTNTPAPTTTVAPTRPPEGTPEPTFPPEQTPEPTFPPSPTPAPTVAPAPAPVTGFNAPVIDPLDRPLMSLSDETGKDTTVDPKHHNVTYERPYLVNLGTSIADGKLTLLSTNNAGGNGSVTNLGNLAPAAGGNNPQSLSPSAGGSTGTNGVNCANAYLDSEWSKKPDERNCVENKQPNQKQPN